jgi:hypothetical protein
MQLQHPLFSKKKNTIRLVWKDEWTIGLCQVVMCVAMFLMVIL